MSSLRTRLDGKIPVLRANLGQILAWSVACLLVGGIVWGVTLSRLEDDRVAAQQAALVTASNLARAYAEYLDHAITQIDQVTMLVRHDWEQERGRLNLETLKREGLFPASELLFVLIADREGRVRTATEAIEPNASVRDRPYFDFHKQNDSRSLRVGAPMTGRFSRQTTIHFTRRLNAPDGSFDGVVVVSVDPKVFTSFYDGAGLGEAGLVGVFAIDGVLRSARIGSANLDQTDAVLRVPFVPRSAEGNQLMAGDEAFVDGRCRFVAWKVLPSHPLFAMVGLDGTEILAASREHRNSVLKALVLGTLGLACFAVLATVLAARLAWQKLQEEQVRDA